MYKYLNKLLQERYEFHNSWTTSLDFSGSSHSWTNVNDEALSISIFAKVLINTPGA